MKPLSFDKFKQWVAKEGYTIEATTRHHCIVDSNGNKVMHFAVSHKAGSKREVKGPYLRAFQKLLEGRTNAEVGD